MPERSPDYSAIALAYDDRYRANPLAGVGQALTSLAQPRACRRVLEVGCGTGRWLELLRPQCGIVIGLDLSIDMLRQAVRARHACPPGRVVPLLVRGCGDCLPFADGAFDLVFCVNALHHFGRPREFISEAHRLLAPGGVVAIIGMDPRERSSADWIYRYFEGTRESDLARFPSWAEVEDWMIADGFTDLEQRPVECIHDPQVGREILSNPFLEKHASSQLALLSDETYADGVRRIEAAIAEAEARGEAVTFLMDVALAMVSGRKP